MQLAPTHMSSWLTIYLAGIRGFATLGPISYASATTVLCRAFYTAGRRDQAAASLSAQHDEPTHDA
jgi:hypothetical protein